jgi:hypothetical protein
MSGQLIRIVLPSLAQRLHRKVKRYRAGKLSDSEFADQFEKLLRNQYDSLAARGAAPADAAVAVHGAVLVLTGPGLRVEAEQSKLPLEVIEYQALRTAAADIAKNHRVAENWAFRRLSSIVAQYAD